MAPCTDGVTCVIELASEKEKERRLGGGGERKGGLTSGKKEGERLNAREGAKDKKHTHI